ncbi:MAG: 30S ribosomal protein S7 [Candidatus Nanoarchaeia archaeon]
MLKLFDRWDTSAIAVKDIGLQKYVNLRETLVPRTCGRNTRRFHKSTYMNIIERLINKLMVPGHKGKKHKLTSGQCSGKWQFAYRTVIKTFEIVENQTKQNPVEVFIRALENAAPREEVTSIEYGGAKYPQAVEVAPQRRIDMVLRLITQGAYAKSWNSKKTIESCLADEILKAYNMDQTSAALSKKLEMERQASSAR